MRTVFLVGDLSAQNTTKCALPGKSMNFGTQVLQTMLFKKIDGSTFLRPFHGRHLGFQNGRHVKPIFGNISGTKRARKLILVATPPF